MYFFERVVGRVFGLGDFRYNWGCVGGWREFYLGDSGILDDRILLFLVGS